MKKIMSTITLVGLISSSLLADNLSQSFKNGNISGDFTLYAERVDTHKDEDSGLAGSVGLEYMTQSYYGLKLSLGVRSSSDFSSEVENGDYGTGGPASILHTANISYNSDLFDFKIGRQRIELEWVKDFHEAYLLTLRPLDVLNLNLGYTTRKARANSNESLIDFGEFSGSDKVYFIDAKYKAFENTNLNTYYYSAANLADWYGAKIDFDFDYFGASAHFANSSIEKNISNNNGSILHVKATSNLLTVDLKAGYIKTDKDTGVSGIMDIMGDNINLFDDGNQVYSADSNTYYLGASYIFTKIQLSALYGQTKYGILENKEKELNFNIYYKATENLNLNAVYVDVDAQDEDDTYQRIEFTASYSF